MNRFFIFLSILFVSLAGCTKSDVSIDNSDYASVSIYAVVPDAPDFNFFLNGNNIAARVPFGSYTLYNRVKPGDVALRAQSISRDINIDTGFNVAAKQLYSLFLTGNVNGIHPILLSDILPSPVADSCGIRFFVLSPGVSGYNFYLVKSGDTTTANKYNGWQNRSYTDDITDETLNIFKKFSVGTYSFYAVSKTNSKDTLARFTNRQFSSDSSNYTLMLEGHFATGDTALMLGSRLH